MVEKRQISIREISTQQHQNNSDMLEQRVSSKFNPKYERNDLFSKNNLLYQSTTKAQMKILGAVIYGKRL